jgi:hypothetical protein
MSPLIGFAGLAAAVATDDPGETKPRWTDQAREVCRDEARESTNVVEPD